MTRAQRFDFDGESLTVAEIMRRVPVLCEKSVREHLRAGRNTSQAMLSYRRPPQRKPGPTQQFRIRYRLPHAFGGPPPSPPRIPK